MIMIITNNSNNNNDDNDINNINKNDDDVKIMNMKLTKSSSLVFLRYHSMKLLTLKSN